MCTDHGSPHSFSQAISRLFWLVVVPLFFSLFLRLDKRPEDGSAMVENGRGKSGRRWIGTRLFGRPRLGIARFC